MARVPIGSEWRHASRRGRGGKTIWRVVAPSKAFPDMVIARTVKEDGSLAATRERFDPTYLIENYVQVGRKTTKAP